MDKECPASIVNYMINCPYFKKCGSCAYATDDYEKSLRLKIAKIHKLFPEQKEIELLPSKPYHYRHKVIYSFFTDKKGEIKAGLYSENSHRIVEIKDCLLHSKESLAIIDDVLKLANSFKLTAFNDRTYKGLLRHLQIRTSYSDRKVLLTFVLGDMVFKGSSNFISELVKKHGEIVGIIFNYNNRHTSVVLGQKEKTVYGRPFLRDKMGPLTFEITSKSFYQVNPEVAYKIYQDAIELSEIKDTDTVLDAYCGTGTISLFAAQRAKRVVGVEINDSAVMSAKKAKRLNMIDNVTFICSDVIDYMQKERFDVVFTDPPRSGMSVGFIKTLLKIKPSRIVYISCNPETMKRDLSLFKDQYYIGNIKFYDQFAFTDHLESLVLLKRKR